MLSISSPKWHAHQKHAQKVARCKKGKLGEIILQVYTQKRLHCTGIYLLQEQVNLVAAMPNITSMQSVVQFAEVKCSM